MARCVICLTLTSVICRWWEQTFGSIDISWGLSHRNIRARLVLIINVVLVVAKCSCPRARERGWVTWCAGPTACARSSIGWAPMVAATGRVRPVVGSGLARGIIGCLASTWHCGKLGCGGLSWVVVSVLWVYGCDYGVDSASSQQLLTSLNFLNY